jgi:hypothetical protein
MHHANSRRGRFFRKNRNKKGGYHVCLTLNTSTAERITAQKNLVSFPSAKNEFFADGNLILTQAKGRSAVHVSMREAG